jgi:hypothetical protein
MLVEVDRVMLLQLTGLLDLDPAVLGALLDGGQLLLDLVHGVGVNEGAVVRRGAHVGMAGQPIAVALL